MLHQQPKPERIVRICTAISGYILPIFEAKRIKTDFLDLPRLFHNCCECPSSLHRNVCRIMSWKESNTWEKTNLSVRGKDTLTGEFINYKLSRKFYLRNNNFLFLRKGFATERVRQCLCYVFEKFSANFHHK